MPTFVIIATDSESTVEQVVADLNEAINGPQGMGLDSFIVRKVSDDELQLDIYAPA